MKEKRGFIRSLLLTRLPPKGKIYGKKYDNLEKFSTLIHKEYIRFFVI